MLVGRLRSGVELTLKQLVAAFEKVQIKPINPQGEKFDPHRHQAISMLPSDQEANTVLTVLQVGYQLHDRVVRPALVTAIIDAAEEHKADVIGVSALLVSTSKQMPLLVQELAARGMDYGTLVERVLAGAALKA